MLQTSMEVSGISSPSEPERDMMKHHQDRMISATLHSAYDQGEVNCPRSRGSNSSSSGGSSSNKEPVGCGVPPLSPASLGSPLTRQPEATVLEAAQEQRLIELLHKASQTIKEERARSAALRQELEELRQSTATLSTMQKLQQENQQLRKQLASMNRQLELSQSHNPQTKQKDGEKEREEQQQSGKSRSLSASRGDSTSSKRSSVKAPLTPLATNTGTYMKKSYSDVEHTKQRAMSLQRHSQLSQSDGSRSHSMTGTQTQKQQQQEEKQQQQRSPSAFKCASQPTVPKTVSSSFRDDDNYNYNDNATNDHAVSNNKWHSVVPRNGETTYNSEMITRLRRALAPPPTKEQLGEVIHAMVQEIVRDTRRRGLDLYMKRQAPCVYQCTFGNDNTQKGKGVAARVVHLSIDSGRLTVKMGGGHVNFLDYLERNRLLLSVYRL
ncbi:putative protein kinase [Trypanosoma theileri]|uniref:Uncharacterized protein n=1 Tax=Trypanosoma theileri TaxID=67003 RepID=A0A1X0NL09_9TRYP|nr:putative protein kinase [Trypanosoma theileri]ORC85462.1 putative protein kinase [Trypanosoma theileri]